MQKIIVKISDMAVSQNPETSLVTYALGSCLGLVLVDPVLNVAGLLHALLPEGKDKSHTLDFNPLKYVDTAVPLLFKKCYTLGATKASLKVYAFGCASIPGAANVMNIGERNLACLQRLLWKNNVFAEKQFVGGTSSRTVEINLQTRCILLKEGNSTQSIPYGERR